MDGPMAAFLQEMEEMRNNTAQIEADIQKVKKAQNEILTTPSVDAKTKQELEDAMNNIKKRANVVRTKLKATEKQVWSLSQFYSRCLLQSCKVRKIKKEAISFPRSLKIIDIIM